IELQQPISSDHLQMHMRKPLFPCSRLRTLLAVTNSGASAAGGHAGHRDHRGALIRREAAIDESHERGQRRIVESGLAGEAVAQYSNAGRLIAGVDVISREPT